MIFYREKEEILRRNGLSTDFSQKFFRNQRKNGDKFKAFGSSFSYHGFFVSADKILYGFGQNSSYQLGLNNDKNHKFALTEIPYFRGKRIKKVCCGGCFSAFLTRKNDFFVAGNSSVMWRKRISWGKRENIGPINHTSMDCTTICGPITGPISHLSKEIRILEIFVGSNHMFFLSKDLELFSVGSNTCGELGLGDKHDRSMINIGKVRVPEKILSVSCGGHFSCFISIIGKMYVCGGNIDGQAGVGSERSITTPVENILFWKRKIIQISCGDNHTLFLSEYNKAYACGYNNGGRLGLGDLNERESIVLVKRLEGKGILFVKCGGQFSVFKSKEKMYICGCNYYGQCCNDSTKDVHYPLERKDFYFDQSVLFYFSSIYIRKGEIFGCGRNEEGELFNEKKGKFRKLIKICDFKFQKHDYLGEDRMGMKERFEYLLNSEKELEVVM